MSFALLTAIIIMILLYAIGIKQTKLEVYLVFDRELGLRLVKICLLL